MKPFSNILQIIDNFHELGQTIQAATFLVNEFGLQNPNFEGFELREKAKVEFILFTTEGNFGEKQIIRIPENVFEFSLELIITLLVHEMVHVSQKATDNLVLDKNEREWQAYYEMLFHKIYANIPDIPVFQKRFFAKKALEYYSKMGENSELQLKYDSQKIEMNLFLASLE